MIGRFLLAGAVGLCLAVPVSHSGNTATVANVTVADYKFVPAELKVRPGTTVRWTNNEKRVSHSVMFLGADGFESDRIFPGESYSRTFDRPGSYPYRCGPHEEMKGNIEVTE